MVWDLSRSVPGVFRSPGKPLIKLFHLLLNLKCHFPKVSFLLNCLLYCLLYCLLNCLLYCLLDCLLPIAYWIAYWIAYTTVITPWNASCLTLKSSSSIAEIHVGGEDAEDAVGRFLPQDERGVSLQIAIQ